MKCSGTHSYIATMGIKKLNHFCNQAENEIMFYNVMLTDSLNFKRNGPRHKKFVFDLLEPVYYILHTVYVCVYVSSIHDCLKLELSLLQLV